MQHTDRIILGIDPGTLLMGYGIIMIRNNSISSLEMDVLKLQKEKDPYKRLEMIHTRVCELISKHKPDTFAIEAPFFGKNVQSMLKLGRAQGVAIAAAMQFGLQVTEYSPKKVKQSITGNGNADKEQVRKMLCHILQKEISTKYYDATDALAVAVCHHFNSKLPAVKGEKSTIKGQKKKGGWEEFISKNQHRVKK